MEKSIKTKCLGCGARNKIDSDDHRLVSYIVSKLKQQKGDKDKKKKKKAKEKNRLKFNL